jgi:tetratricopeptide (TPR) repeat protein
MAMKVPRSLLVLFLAGCATTPDPEESRLIDRFKRGEWEEAFRDTGPISSALARYVEELAKNGAPPAHLLEATGRFWKSYPFDLLDLDVEIGLLERVADTEAESRAALEGATPGCRREEPGLSLESVALALRALPEHHQDGGRCARRFYRFFRDRASSAARPSTDDYHDLRSVLGMMMASCGEDPYVLLAGLRVEEIGRHAGIPGDEAFPLADLESGRWERFLKCHQAMLRVGVWRRGSDWTEFEYAGTFLARDGPSPELRTLGRTLVSFHQHFGECKQGKDARADLDRDVAEIERACSSRKGSAPGNLFPKAALLGRVEAWLALGKHREVLDELRKRPAPDRDAMARALLMIATELQSADDRSGSRALLAEIDRDYGYHPVALSARTELGEILLGEGDEDRAAQILEKVVRRTGIFPFSEVADRSPDAAVSRAGELLARIYERRKDWEGALRLWTDWLLESFCGTCGHEMKLARELGIGRALEGLGRAKEAVPHYLAAALETEEGARRLLAVYRSLGRLEAFKEWFDRELRKAEPENPELTRYAGLQWLKVNFEK